MKSILVLSFTDLSKDPRPFKQIKLLNNKYNITSVGKKPSGYENKFIQYEKESIVREIFRLTLLINKNYRKYYWSKSNIEIKNKLKNEVFDLIIAHDEKTLPLAQEISSGAKIILDAHEYHLEEHDGSVIGKCLKGYVKYLYTNLIKTPDAMITVCNSISEKYYNVFNLKSKVIMNVPDYIELHPVRIQNNKIKLIHHGLAT